MIKMAKICIVNLNIKMREINGILRRCYYIDYIEYDLSKLLKSFSDKTDLIENPMLKELEKNEEDINC
jgi:hypothetical protein